MKSLVYGLFILLLTSCAMQQPFTEQVKTKHELTEGEIKQLQFYVSHDIILFRAEAKPSGKKTTTEGTLTVSDGKDIEKVIIKAGTPGIVEKILPGGKLAMRFEEGEGAVLIFGDPQNNNGRFTLMAADWDAGVGTVMYKGKKYTMSSVGHSPYLKFKMKKLNQVTNDQRVVKGMKVN